MNYRTVWKWWLGIVFAQAVRGDFVSTDYETYNDGELGHRPHLEFQSSSEYAPVLHVNVWDSDAISQTGSHIFLRHDGNDSSPLSSPLILDANDLSAVYMNRTFDNVFGTRVQDNLGTKYLTFWAGDKGDGIGDGYGFAFDDTYNLVYKVSAQNMKVHSDLHEFAFTGNGTALVTGVNHIQVRGADLRERQGWDNIPDELDILDGVFQEIDLETNELIFDWRALDHINPMDSFELMNGVWDAYHINSIEKTQAGNYLISVRHTHSIHLIDGQTGDIIWSLGGVFNNFIEQRPTANLSWPALPLLTMAWQHHARFVPGTNETQLTFFDNHAKVTTHGECDSQCSRGLHISINTTVTPPTAQLLNQFYHPMNLQAQSQGSVQPLTPSMEGLGNVFIGWGRCPSFTEHTPSGETVLNVQFSPWHSADIPDALDNYRAYKMNWAATPWWDPAIALKQGVNGTLAIYMSWNGATEVAEWVVRGSVDNSTESTILATSRRTGFETKLTIGSYDGQYLWADAVDANGNVLRWSEIVDLNVTKLSNDSSTAYAELESSFQPLSQNTTDYTTSSSSSTPDSSGLSTTAIVSLSVGLGVMALTIVATVVFFIRRRRRSSDYNSLEASEFELPPDDDHFEIGDDSDHDGEPNEDQAQPEVDADRQALLSKPG
ncbi:ASST-domain-containing protein [Aspergillus californicus]